LMQLLSTSTKRAQVLAENLANANTPGYQRRVVRFEELLRGALESGRDTTDIKPRIDVDRATPSRADGNNVTMELELNAMRENRLLYETYSTILSSRMELVRTSIEQSR
jgi:flagellar basal-body rod protein FlgB